MYFNCMSCKCDNSGVYRAEEYIKHIVNSTTGMALLIAAERIYSEMDIFKFCYSIHHSSNLNHRCIYKILLLVCGDTITTTISSCCENMLMSRFTVLFTLLHCIIEWHINTRTLISNSHKYVTAFSIQHFTLWTLCCELYWEFTTSFLSLKANDREIKLSSHTWVNKKLTCQETRNCSKTFHLMRASLSEGV